MQNVQQVWLCMSCSDVSCFGQTCLMARRTTTALVLHLVAVLITFRWAPLPVYLHNKRKFRADQILKKGHCPFQDKCEYAVRGKCQALVLMVHLSEYVCHLLSSNLLSSTGVFVSLKWDAAWLDRMSSIPRWWILVRRFSLLTPLSVAPANVSLARATFLGTNWWEHLLPVSVLP